MAANEVGTITVRGDTRGIKKITTALREMGRRSDQTEKKASRLGKTIGRLAAGVSVGLFARKVIQNTKEQEQAVAQLNATLKSTGRFSDETSQALQNQAAALQRLTTYGDEAIIRAQSLLLSFRRIGGEAFPDATMATLNLATVMQTDLKSAALQVGKALEDPARQMSYLARSGISFTKAQMDMAKELQAAGDLAGAQAIVLKELETQFGNSAEAARNTFGGALSAVGNAFNDLLEGDEGTISAATDSLNELEETLNDPKIQEGFQKLISATVTTVEWFAKGVTAVTNFGTALGEFFGELVNGPTIDDPAGIRKELELQRAELARSENAWIQWGADEYQDKVRARIKVLEDMLAISEDLANAPTPEGPDNIRATATAAIDFAEDPDSVLVPIELDNADLKEKIAKMSEDLRREFARMGREAGEELSQSVAEGSAALAGPGAEAALEYTTALQEIDTWEKTLQATQQLTIQNQQLIAQARENALEVYDRELEAIEKERLEREAQLTPAQEMIAALETELELMKLGANEREREIVSRKLAGEATEEQLAQIDALILKRQEAARGIEALDEFRSASADLFVDFASGSKSMGDAFDDFARRIRQRALELIAEKLIEQIFGAFGTAGGGSAGGGWASVIGSFFGGGRAGGGTVYPGRIHPVNELGPEMLSVGSRDYLLAPPEGGSITPARDVQKTENRALTVNITVPETTPKKTIDQAAKTFAQVQRRASARNS